MAESKEKPQNENDTNAQSGKFAVQKIYVRDISFETPHSPEIFTEEWKPVVNMDLSTESKSINEELIDVVLTVTVTVSLGEKTAYLVEVNQAGIFYVKDFPEEAMERLKAIVCPNMLFPFAREVVSDIVVRGGFPQLLLSPVNFEALYAQHKKQQKQNGSPQVTGSAGKTRH